MKEIKDLELNIMSCLLIKPELMEQIILKDKHFKKHQRLWQFMKSFYKKFKTFDIQLMYSVCKDKWHILKYILMLVEIETTTINFMKYQKQLIEEIEKTDKEQWLIEKIYVLANDLFVGNINCSEFNVKVNELYKNSEIIFKNNNQNSQNT